LLANELHDENVLAQQDRLRASNASGVQPRVVAHLLLGPELDHLAWVALAVALSESKLARHVAITILEDQDAGLVDLDGHLAAIELRRRVIHVGLHTSPINPSRNQSINPSRCS